MAKLTGYQVFSGSIDKHSRQGYSLEGTYLNINKALTHFHKIVDDTPLYGDKLEIDDFKRDGKLVHKTADAVGWERVIIAKLEMIEITD